MRKLREFRAKHRHPRTIRGRTVVMKFDRMGRRVEETIRYIKQSYRLEHMRLLDYQRLKNMAALVVAVSYFAAAWLGRKVKLEALANHVAKVSRKMYEAPEFFYYAIADGLRWLFVKLMKTARGFARVR